MRILDFKKGDAVPDWLASTNWKHASLVFLHDVKVVKNGPMSSIHVETVTNGVNPVVLFDIEDKRPAWLRWLDRLRLRTCKVDLSHISGWSAQKLDYEQLRMRNIKGVQ